MARVRTGGVNQGRAGAGAKGLLRYWLQLTSPGDARRDATDIARRSSSPASHSPAVSQVPRPSCALTRKHHLHIKTPPLLSRAVLHLQLARRRCGHLRRARALQAACVHGDGARKPQQQSPLTPPVAPGEIHFQMRDAGTRRPGDYNSQSPLTQ